MSRFEYATEQTAPTGGPAGNNPLAAVIEEQLEAARQAQEEILEDCQHAFERWCARRHQTTAAIAELNHAALHASSSPELVRAWLQWSAGTVTRLLEDSKDQMELGMSLARSCTEGQFSAIRSCSSAELKGRSSVEKSFAKAEARPPMT